MRKLKFTLAALSLFSIFMLSLTSVIVQASFPAGQPVFRQHHPGHAASPFTTTASITITKGPDFQQARTGQTITFTLAITNTGDITLTNVSVSDPLAASCERDIGDMAPNASHTYQCSAAYDDDITNTATVKGKNITTGESIEASDSARVDITPSTFIYDDTPTAPIPIKLDTECFSSGMITRTFTVDEDFTVGDVNIGLNIDHTFRSEIWAFLTSPRGTQVVLTTECINCDPDNNYDMMLDDSSSNPQDDGDDDDTAPPYYDRDAAPFRPLTEFIGEPAHGVWTLEICDQFSPQHHGQYNRSRLVLQDATLLAQKRSDKVILLPTSSMHYTIIFTNHSKTKLENVRLEDVVPASVNYTPGSLQASTGNASESNGIITWQGDLASGDTVTLTFGSDVAIDHAALITNTATITHPILAEPLHPTIIGQVFTDALHIYTNETDMVIPDGHFGCKTPISSTVYVDDDYYIGDIEAGVTAKHTMRSDLLIDLIAPWGETVSVDTGQGGSNENLDARFADRGSQDALAKNSHDVDAPYYEILARPPGGDDHRSPLSPFDAHPAKGEWTLRICDEAQVDTGALRQWTLFVEEANVWLGYDDAWSHANNWSKGHAPQTTEYAIIPTAPEGGYFPVLDGSVIIENLLLQEDAQLDIRDHELYVEDYMDNYGVITQTLPVTAVNTPVDFLHITNQAGDSDKYNGLVITPTISSLGQVTVSISGNQNDGCTDVPSDSLLTRCYRIQPEHPVSSTIKFYYSETERNKQDANNLTVWRRGLPAYQWRQEGEGFTFSETSVACQSDNGYTCWVEAQAVNRFGRLTIGTPAPPAISPALHGSDIKLSWHDDTCCITHYEVWRAPIPYFNPTFSQATKLSDVATNSTHDYDYVDAGVVNTAGENYYYVIRSHFTRDQTTDANIVGIYNVPLTPGTN